MGLADLRNLVRNFMHNFLSAYDDYKELMAFFKSDHLSSDDLSADAFWAGETTGQIFY